MPVHHQSRRFLGPPVVAACLLALAACGDDSSSGESTRSGATTSTSAVIDPGDGGHYAPHIDPADFGGPIDNPYMPLAPGSRWVYEGVSDGEHERTEVAVTDQHRRIMGIDAVVVRDTVSVGGEVTEDTYDWFAQDGAGNVWYLGEDSKEYEHGEVTSTAGSWEAGVDGALAGIVMPAHPAVGQAYRQEFAKGEAEDLGEVVRVGATAEAGGTTYGDVVVVKEWNPLEPDVVEEKSYAPGIGVVLERTTAGGEERAELSAFTAGTSR